MKKLFRLSILVLGLAFISSCEKDDEVEPQIVTDIPNIPNGTEYDTTIHQLHLGTILADTFLVNGKYVMRNSYTLSLKEIFTGFTPISQDIKNLFVADKSAYKFYEISHQSGADDVTVKLICESATYGTNEHIIKASIVTDTEVHLVTFTFNILEDETQHVIKTLLASSPSSAGEVTTQDSDTWTQTFPQSFLVEEIDKSFDMTFYFPGNPLSAGSALIGSHSIDSFGLLILYIGTNNKIYVSSYGVMDLHTITSAANGKVFLNGSTGLTYIDIK